jgi:2-keto-4-pentenoate hydratase/2-oxohepta-3-ene-1,7-dioic acid hydratase in catechol pathway
MADDKKIIFSMVGVSKAFQANKQVLKDIYLSFFYGAKIGIIGLNGSGKSTLMKIIAGLEKSYQGELAVIIGKEGKNIKSNEVYSYIFGYTIINDSSARDLQKKHSQWFKGKSMDDTCSFGPYIIYKEEVSYPPQLNLCTYVNGELRQKGNTRDFIFDLAYSISEFSKGTTLKPGDIIATGTPQGVGMGFTPPKFLKNKDILKIEIEKIGVLENKIVEI